MIWLQGFCFIHCSYVARKFAGWYCTSQLIPAKIPKTHWTKMRTKDNLPNSHKHHVQKAKKLIPFLLITNKGNFFS